jgi:hypothetical protein
MISFVWGDEAAVPQPSALHYTYADRRLRGKSDEMQISRHEMQKGAPNGAAYRVASIWRLG